jgi:hypothetical protein
MPLEHPSDQNDELKIPAPEQDQRYNMYGSTVVKVISKYFNTHPSHFALLREEHVTVIASQI